MSEDIQREETIMESPMEESVQEVGNTVGVHPFDRMFFGRRGIQNRRGLVQKEQEPANSGSIDGMLDGILNNETFKNIDFDEMLNHVDKLMVSLSELRPMFKKVTPFMEKFLQKDK
ncbi:hypothetical protein [Heyndrickxia acidicola]|uniref:Uncharacterized protein n=1 Tax=Heyndrickxia acidicola TaxID=209389 RepID=A0ABU6MCX2_9BACI|nr:hypothetical protein [Heyndrickxia acidicola]MED1202504.1 hypothetical protein [Heyndrickxia acidicola]